MNEDDNKSKLDSIMSGDNSNPSGETDWKARCHELENKLNGARVEAGRVKKLDEELKAANEELERYRNSKSNEALMSELSDDERAGIPEEVLQATAKMVRKAQDDSERRYREMENRRQEEDEANRKSAIERFVDSRFPKFWNDVGPGGDKAESWGKYRKYNEASILGAISSGDTESISYHIERFYNDHLGIPVPSVSQDGSAAPDAANHGGGYTGSSRPNGRTYTSDEFMALYDALEVARDKGDAAEMARLNAEIKSAPAEGRVK